MALDSLDFSIFQHYSDALRPVLDVLLVACCGIAWMACYTMDNRPLYNRLNVSVCVVRPVFQPDVACYPSGLFHNCHQRLLYKWYGAGQQAGLDGSAVKLNGAGRWSVGEQAGLVP